MSRNIELTGYDVFTKRLHEAILAGYGNRKRCADALDITGAAVSLWFRPGKDNGNSHPTLENLSSICTKSGYSADYILGLTNRRYGYVREL